MYHECSRSLNRAAASQHLRTSPAGLNFSSLYACTGTIAAYTKHKI